MYETNVTVVGRLTTDVSRHQFGDGTGVANFRVASTERRQDRATGGWVDGDTLFVEVRCRRKLAENAAACLVKGDPVVVTGRLYTRNYEHEGQRRTAVTIDAHNVGADLLRCTVVLKRDRQASTATAVPGDQGADASNDVVEPAALVGVAPGGEG